MFEKFGDRVALATRYPNIRELSSRKSSEKSMRGPCGCKQSDSIHCKVHWEDRNKPAFKSTKTNAPVDMPTFLAAQEREGAWVDEVMLQLCNLVWLHRKPEPQGPISYIPGTIIPGDARPIPTPMATH